MQGRKSSPECYGEYYTQPIEVCEKCDMHMSCFIETEAHSTKEED